MAGMSDRNEIYRRFGRLLTRRRKKAGLTQEKLATFLGLSRTSIANIERGRQPVQLHTLYSIADALDAEILDLVPALPRSDNALPIDPGQVGDLNVKEEQFLRKIASPVTKPKGR